MLRVSAGSQWLLFLPLAYALGPGLGLALTGVMLAELAYRATMMAIYIRRWRSLRPSIDEKPDA